MDTNVLQCKGMVKNTVLKYINKIDKKTGQEWIETALRGKPVLTTPLLNKDTAFTDQERKELGLLGKLPNCIETLEQQVARISLQYQRYASNLQKFIYLNGLHDKNEILFYRFLLDNLAEALPIIYTPNVGTAVKEYSHEFRQPRGLYISYPHIDEIDDVLEHRTHPDVDVIVATDGEGVLGIGDQGIGAMDISIAKLVVYSLCGINPYRTLPIMLDVGTDNQQLLDDPMYIGWRSKRIRGDKYHTFIEKFVKAVHRKLPNVFLHWEDFGRENARSILDRYKDYHCMFNDDMQGTGVISLAAIIAAIGATSVPIQNHRIIIFGAGTAGVGIADQLYDAMLRYGMDPQEARKRFWLMDRPGVLLEDTPGLMEHQRKYARTKEEAKYYPPGHDLLTVVQQVKPTILIGTSTVRGAFTEEVIRTIAQHVAQPIIFPLSNPNDNCEANPENVLKWTEGRALIATGSPFDPVMLDDRKYVIAQCNNALAFPGIGLGVIVSRAKAVTDNMLWAAVQAICERSPAQKDPKEPLLPSVADITSLASHIAVRVAEQAIRDGVSNIKAEQSIENLVRASTWEPYYRTIKAV